MKIIELSLFDGFMRGEFMWGQLVKFIIKPENWKPYAIIAGVITILSLGEVIFGYSNFFFQRIVCDFKAADIDGFRQAIEKNDLIAVNRYLDNCADPSLGIDVEGKGVNAAMLAANLGHLNIFKRLITNPWPFPRSDVENDIDGARNSVLHHAAKGCQEEMIEYIIRAYPKLLTNQNEDKKTPRQLAASNCSGKIYRLLLHATRINSTIDSNRIELLGFVRSSGIIVPQVYANPLNEVTRNIIFEDFLIAIAEGDLKAVRTIFEEVKKQGIAYSFSKKTGRNALNTAISSGQSEIIELLIKELGFPVDQVDGNGVTAIMEATVKFDSKTIAVLINNGSTIRDSKGKLEWIQKLPSGLVKNQLIERKGYLTKKLRNEVEKGQTNNVNFLVNNGGDPYFVGAWDRNIFALAAGIKQESVARQTLQTLIKILNPTFEQRTDNRIFLEVVWSIEDARIKKSTDSSSNDLVTTRLISFLIQLGFKPRSLDEPLYYLLKEMECQDWDENAIQAILDSGAVFKNTIATLNLFVSAWIKNCSNVTSISGLKTKLDQLVKLGIDPSFEPIKTGRSILYNWHTDSKISNMGKEIDEHVDTRRRIIFDWWVPFDPKLISTKYNLLGLSLKLPDRHYFNTLNEIIGNQNSNYRYDALIDLYKKWTLNKTNSKQWLSDLEILNKSVATTSSKLTDIIMQSFIDIDTKASGIAMYWYLKKNLLTPYWNIKQKNFRYSFRPCIDGRGVCNADEADPFELSLADALLMARTFTSDVVKAKEIDYVLLKMLKDGWLFSSIKRVVCLYAYSWRIFNFERVENRPLPLNDDFFLEVLMSKRFKSDSFNFNCLDTNMEILGGAHHLTPVGDLSENVFGEGPKADVYLFLINLTEASFQQREKGYSDSDLLVGQIPLLWMSSDEKLRLLNTAIPIARNVKKHILEMCWRAAGHGRQNLGEIYELMARYAPEKPNDYDLKNGAHSFCKDESLINGMSRALKSDIRPYCSR